MAMNASGFLAALEEIETSKGISKENILQMLEDSLLRAYKKQLGGDDAVVKVDINLDKGTIEMYQIKQVVEEVDDDFLQISVSDANALDTQRKYQAGEEFLIYANLDEMKKATAMGVKSMLKQKFVEAEKSVLYETFKDKIGTIITGKVEKVDERGISVNIVKTSVYLPKKELIGEEKFVVGETIKIYVDDVAGGNKGAHIVVSRSKEGFLKCLFTEEIHEIYDGTIEIKGIAREAGERSKIAVYSKNPSVDPAGACIGPNGSRIQKIVAQLGNGGINKEKIDIIGYSDNPSLFILEALKPARAVGIVLDSLSKRAIAIVKDDTLSLAIGRRGVNVRLAVKLTGYNIDVKTETDALASNLPFVSSEAIQAEENIKIQTAKAQVAFEAENPVNVLPGLPQGYIAPQDRIYKDSSADYLGLDEDLEDEIENKEQSASFEKPVAPKEETVVVAPAVKEEITAPVEVAPAVVEEEIKVVVEEPIEVKTTTSIEELEKALLEKAVNKPFVGAVNKKVFKRNFKKNEEETVPEEDASKVIITTGERMSIYTEEEMREFEKEEKVEEEFKEEEVDYDEFDKYYEDDVR